MLSHVEDYETSPNVNFEKKDNREYLRMSYNSVQVKFFDELTKVCLF